MCNLDRSLFMGYIVLEILNIWEEHRKDVTLVEWRYPEVDRESMFTERLKRLTETNTNPTSLELKKLEAIVDPPQPPKWADVASGKCKVEGRPVLKATPALKHDPSGHSEYTVKGQKPVDVANLHEQPPEVQSSRSIDPKYLYTEILKGKPEPKKNFQSPGSSVSGLTGGAAAESSATGKRYKAKKEKKRHGFDLDDDVNYHKVEIIPWNGKQQVESPSQHSPPVIDSQIRLRPEQSKEEVSKDNWVSGQGYEFEVLKSHIMHEIDLEIKVEREAVGGWLQRLQMWLWTFNEGLGVEFVEIPEHRELNSEKSTEAESDHEPADSAGCVMGGLEGDHGKHRLEVQKRLNGMAKRGVSEGGECSMKRILSE